MCAPDGRAGASASDTSDADEGLFHVKAEGVSSGGSHQSCRSQQDEGAGSLDVAALTAQLLRTDRTSGARRAAPEALRAVNAARHQVEASHTLHYEALTELLQVAAWILFDAEQHRLSHVLNHQALKLSRRLPGERRSIELLVRSVLCLQQAHLGRPSNSLRISSAVLAGQDLPERVAAIFHVREARAYAQLRLKKEALRSLSAAEELLGDNPSDRDPSWAWWFDRTELTGHRGLALADLGDLEAAASHLHDATATSEAPAYRSLFSTELASALARAGAWREADAWMAPLVEAVPQMGSVRSLNSLMHATRIIDRGRSVPRGLRNTGRHLAELLHQQDVRLVTGPGNYAFD
ncbi:hypothetical protein ABZ543_17190 [Streptomyces roseifaciens]